MDIEKIYTKMQKASGIKDGYKVKYLRRFASYEMGFGCIFGTAEELTVGNTYTVDRVDDTGILLDTQDFVPFFALEIVEPAIELELRVMSGGKDVTDKMSKDSIVNLAKARE